MSNKLVQKNNHWTWKTTTGVAIIFFGLIALISNYVDLSLPFELSGNWWAYFILVPAFSTLSTAWKVSRESNGVSPRAIGLIVGGLCMLLLVPIFLFNWNLGQVWPLFIILAGVGMVLITIAPSRI